MKTDGDNVMENNKLSCNYPGNDKLIQAKNVFFYRDGNEKRGFVKIAVHPNRHRSLDALLNELTQKMPDLSFGVRSIYTPKGHDRLVSLNDLNTDEIFVCSQSSNKAKGIDINKIKKPLWNFKSLNHVRYNTAPLKVGETELRIKKFDKKDDMKKLRAPASVPESESDQILTIQNQLAQNYHRKFLPGLKKGENKRILIKKNGNSDYQQVVLLNRRTARTFEQFMDDLCGIFLMPVRRLYTLEGKEVQSLSGVFNGPTTFVAAGYERFRPMPAWSNDLSPSLDYKISNGHSKSRPPLRPAVDKGQWIIRIETLDTESHDGTTANVFLTIYGKHRVTAPLALKNQGNVSSRSNTELSFQAGQIDEFEVTVGSIGDIVKIRLNHDNQGDTPDWHVGTVQMENKDTHEHLMFTFNCWLSLTKENCEVVKELPRIQDDSFVLPVVKYRINITTGDCWNAGTDGKVFICLYGTHGDTGPRQLLKPVTYSSKLFEKGNCDTFEIESVSLGRLQRLIIGHNAIGPGKGWFLDKVVVRAVPLSNENQISDRENIFYCKRWLDHGEDDGKTTRELKLQDDFQHNVMEKEMWEYEKWKFQKGNVIIIFSQTTWKCIRITESGSVDASGDEKESECHFEVAVGDHPEVCRFKSKGHNGKMIIIKGAEVTGGGSRETGALDSDFKIRVQPDRTVVLETMRFVNHHIMVNHNDSTLIKTRGPVSLPGKAFYVHCKGVFRNKAIICFCTSLIQTLAVSHDNTLTATGKRNKTAHFMVHKIMDDQKCYMFESLVFRNQFIRIKNGRCDCKGSGEKDCLFKVEKYKEHGYVTLKSIENQDSYIGMNPDGIVKPALNSGNKNINFYPEVIRFGLIPDKKYHDSTSINEVQTTKNKLSSQSFTNLEITEQISVNTAELSNLAVEKDYYTEGDWKVSVYTTQAALNCEIILVIYGEEGCSGPIILGRSQDENELFETGAMNEFKINVPIIGYLYKVRLELKSLSEGNSPFWCLQQIVMENIVTEESYTFPFDNRFFGRGYEDNELSREAVALSTGGSIPIVKYKILMVTGTELGAECNVPISVGLFGEYGDSGIREFYSPFSDTEPAFRRGMTDQMTIECAYLGELKRCQVTVHSNTPDSGWFCHKVTVEDPITKTQLTFPANLWFDSHRGDRKTSRFLEPETDYKAIEAENEQPEESNLENPEDFRLQAKEIIEQIAEQAANHLERFHEIQNIQNKYKFSE